MYYGIIMAAVTMFAFQFRFNRQYEKQCGGTLRAAAAFSLGTSLVGFIILLALMAVGFGMIFSSMTTKYRDLQIMLAKIVSLWVYVTPVIYPLSMVTNEKLHLAMSLNPVTPVMEAIKYSLLGQGQFSWLWLAYSAVFTLILLIFGLMMFNKVQKSFMDTV